MQYRFNVKTWNETHVGVWQDVADVYNVASDEDVERAVLEAIDKLFAESKVLALKFADGSQRHIPVHAIEWVDVDIRDQTDQTERAWQAVGESVAQPDDVDLSAGQGGRHGIELAAPAVE
jgi:hypothetical protein